MNRAGLLNFALILVSALAVDAPAWAAKSVASPPAQVYARGDALEGSSAAANIQHCLGASDWLEIFFGLVPSMATRAFAAELPEKKKGTITEVQNADGDFVILDKQALRDAEAKAGGIGVRLAREKDGVFAEEIFEASPAKKSGLEIGDIILSIDGRSLAGQSLAAIAQLLRGRPGTTVVLKAMKKRTGRIAKLSLIRAELAPSQTSEQNITIRNLELKALGLQSCPPKSDECNLLTESSGICRYTCRKK